VRDAFAFGTFTAKSFRAPAAPELLSLCVAKEKDNQRERPPRLALAGLLPGKSVSRGRAFRSGIGQPLLRCLNSGIHAVACPSEKESTSLSTPAARPVDPDSPPHRGPGRAAGHRGPHSVRSLGARAKARARAQYCRAPLLSAFDPALLKSTRRMRVALPGAPLQRRAGEGKPAGWPARMPASLASGQATAGMPELRQRRTQLPDALSTNPVARTQTLRAWMPARRGSGVAFSFGYFSLGHAREK
jgi:hypothetical protein